MRHAISISGSALLVFLSVTPVCGFGQLDSAGSTAVVLNRLSGFSALPNGIEVKSGAAREQITALREHCPKMRRGQF
jgi:hypothetical protein